MLDIHTFDARQGGSVCTRRSRIRWRRRRSRRWYRRLAAAGPVVVVDPDDVIEALLGCIRTRRRCTGCMCRT